MTYGQLSAPQLSAKWIRQSKCSKRRASRGSDAPNGLDSEYGGLELRRSSPCSMSSSESVSPATRYEQVRKNERRSVAFVGLPSTWLLCALSLGGAPSALYRLTG